MHKRTAVQLTFIAYAILFAAGLTAAQTWKDEFDRICVQTVEATSLSTEQLRSLVNDSDALLKRLEGVNDPGKKVYVLRLQKCRSFFLYMIELKESGGATGKQSAP